MLRAIVRQVEEHKTDDNLSQRLDQWQRAFSEIGNLVKQITKCFGFVMLVFLTFMFVWMINGCFTFLLEFRENGAQLLGNFLLLMVLASLVCFAFVCYIPHQINDEVSHY